MIHDLQTRRNDLPTTNESNPYIAFADAALQRRIVGSLLKFDKFGEWISGESGDVLPIGTELVAQMEELHYGWIKWEDGKPVEQIMGRVKDEFTPPKRNELGDTDKEEWPVDDDGRSRDPWQFSYYLILKAANSDELYTFATSSKGGKDAIAKLAKVFGAAQRYREDQFPVVALNQSFYMHPNKEFGKIKTPQFDLVAWTSRDEIDRVLLAQQGGTAEDQSEQREPERVAAKPTATKTSNKPKTDQSPRF